MEPELGVGFRYIATLHHCCPTMAVGVNLRYLAVMYGMK
jgi:hypothetical protein